MGLDTGHGASVTFVTSAWTAAITSISIDEQSIPDVDRSHLGTSTHREYQPGDLIEPGGFTMDILVDPDDLPPPLGTVQTVRVDFPLQSGQSAPAKVEGSGYINSWSIGEMTTDAMMTGTVAVKWDGITPPAFTDAT